MAVVSKTTILENFKEMCGSLCKEDGKSPYRDYRLDQKLIPSDAESMEGTWEITVSFTPKNVVLNRK